MTRFLATRLDLSRLRANKPALITDLDFEAIRQARLDSLQGRFDEAAEKAGTDPLDVLSLETDPVVILQEEDAYRQLLDLAHLNDIVRDMLPAFALGANLDHIAARSGITRQVIRPAVDSTPAVMEDDDTFRMRYFASFGVPSAGSEDAYIFAALTAYPSAWHVYCNGPTEHGEPGRVDVIVTAPGGVAVPDATLFAITRACNAKAVRPLTDFVNVVGAEPAPYAVVMTVEILPGPDPVALRSEIVARLQAIVAERYRGGGEVPKSALASAAYEFGAVSVAVASPAADIPRQVQVAPWCTGITVNVVERLYD